MRAGPPLLLALCLATACSDPPPSGPDFLGKPVVLFTVDTLRADRLGPWSEGRIVTPHLDALAAESVVFERAYSQASYTHPSLMSIFTGLVPPRHGVVRQHSRILEGVVTVPAILQAGGVATGHFTANLCQFQEVPGTLFSVGWDEVHCGIDNEVDQYLWDRSVIDAALEWIESVAGGPNPWFAWVHLMDPHHHHRPSPAHWDYAETPLGTLAEEDQRYQSWEQEGRMPPDDVRQNLEALYAAEIAGVDDHLGRFLAALEEIPGGTDASLLFGSDHGEELYETWPRMGHSWSLTEGVLHVPLMVRADGVAPGRVPEQVETLSIAPTLLELFGLSSPYNLDGASLLQPERAVAVARSFEERIAVTLREGEHRYWHRFADAPFKSERWPWREDVPWFQEKRSLARYEGNTPTWLSIDGEASPVLEEFEDRVRELYEVVRKPANAPEEINDPAVLEQLKALGYL